MKMKVIAINGSARKEGNTALMIRTVLGELEKEGIATEYICLAGRMIEPCKACWACGGRRNCVHHKDIFQEIFEKIKEADGILLGSPVYSANISSSMQAVLERAAVVCDMNPGLMKHKVGAAVAAVRRAGSLQAVDSMNHFFLNHEMFVCGSTYWNMGYGQLPGDVLKDEEGMANMRNLGQNMAFLLKAVGREEI
jgi:multimeric flavodoxin WrbA